MLRIPDKHLLRSIAALAAPAVVTNLTTPVLALCDVAIVGHMGNAVFIAAIAVGGTMFNMLYWLCGFLRMGSSGTTAQAYGAGDIEGAHVIGRRALLLALAMGLVFILLRYPLCEALMKLIDAQGATDEMASQYFLICIWGAPAVLSTFVLTGWFLGMQNSRIPMWVSVFTVLFNILVSVVLVFRAGLKIEGVAYGTLSAQWAGLIVAFIAYLKRYGMPRVDMRRFFDMSEISRFFRINSDIFLRTLCLVAVTMWFTRIGAMQGTVMLAVNTLLMQLFTIFSYMMDGIAFSAEALCGRYSGAGDNAALKRTVNGLMTLGAIFSVAFTLVYFFGGDAFLSILSSNHEVVNRAGEYEGWAVSIPVVSVMAFVWDGIMIGLTRTRAMLLSMLIGAIIYFGLYFMLFPHIGNHGLWIAFLSYLFARGLTLYIIGTRDLRKG